MTSLDLSRRDTRMASTLGESVVMLSMRKLPSIICSLLDEVVDHSGLRTLGSRRCRSVNSAIGEPAWPAGRGPSAPLVARIRSTLLSLTSQPPPQETRDLAIAVPA